MTKDNRVVICEIPFVVRMMPDQKPYTPEEWAGMKRLVRDAALGDPGEGDEYLVIKQDI